MNILSVIITTPFMFFYYKLNDELEKYTNQKISIKQYLFISRFFKRFARFKLFIKIGFS